MPQTRQPGPYNPSLETGRRRWTREQDRAFAVAGITGAIALASTTGLIYWQMWNHQLPAEKHHELHQRWREYEELPEVQRQKPREGHQVTGKPGR